MTGELFRTSQPARMTDVVPLWHTSIVDSTTSSRNTCCRQKASQFAIEPQAEEQPLMIYRTALTTPIFGLRREIDRLFEDTFGNAGARGAWAPMVDVRE